MGIRSRIPAINPQPRPIRIFLFILFVLSVYSFEEETIQSTGKLMFYLNDWITPDFSVRKGACIRSHECKGCQAGSIIEPDSEFPAVLSSNGCNDGVS